MWGKSLDHKSGDKTLFVRQNFNLVHSGHSLEDLEKMDKSDEFDCDSYYDAVEKVKTL